MYNPKTFRIPSVLGAVLAATLMTVVSTLPEAVHAQDGSKATCTDKVPHDFKPSLQ